MSFCSPIYANKICAEWSAGSGPELNREDDITVISHSRWVNPTISLDNIALHPQSTVALDVCDKLVEIHLVSASRRHEAWSMHNFTATHDAYMRAIVVTTPGRNV